MEVPCPTCNKAIVWSSENAYRPFCSHRCQLIDLGAWAAEEHRIPAEPAFLSDDEAMLAGYADENSLH
jgi:endogenous inhibitor of DNA gyrase (YacG/DUF329 family)